MTKTMAGIRERKVTPKWRFMADFPCKTEGRDSLCKTVSQDLYYLAALFSVFGSCCCPGYHDPTCFL
jgi:hypothetical protein